MFILSGPELHGTYLPWFCLSLQADSPTGRSWNKPLASLWESSPNKCKSLGACVWVYRGVQDPRCLYYDSLTLRYLLLVGVDIGQEDKMMSENSLEVLILPSPSQCECDFGSYPQLMLNTNGTSLSVGASGRPSPPRVFTLSGVHLPHISQPLLNTYHYHYFCFLKADTFLLNEATQTSGDFSEIFSIINSIFVRQPSYHLHSLLTLSPKFQGLLFCFETGSHAVRASL